MEPGGSRGLQSRCEARRTSRVRSIRMHLRQSIVRSCSILPLLHDCFRLIPVFARPRLLRLCPLSQDTPAAELRIFATLRARL